MCVADRFIIDDVDSISSVKEKITFLNRCYASYIAAYGARFEHRDRCVVPDCRDWGHDQQFIIIQNKIDKCELRLEKLYDEIILHQQKDFDLLVEEENNTTYDAKEEDLSFMDNVKSFKQKRSDDTKETNKIIANYIKENRVILKRKKEMIDFCYAALLKFVKSDKLVYHHMMCMMMIILKVYYGTKGKDFCDYDNTESFVLSSKAINAYTNMRDFFSENQIH